MNICLPIGMLPEDDQYRIYVYLKNKFESSAFENTALDASVKEIECFSARLKFVLLRNGIQSVSDLLALTHQDLVNLSGVGAKSRNKIQEYCDQIRASSN